MYPPVDRCIFILSHTHGDTHIHVLPHLHTQFCCCDTYDNVSKKYLDMNPFKDTKSMCCCTQTPLFQSYKVCNVHRTQTDARAYMVHMHPCVRSCIYF